MSKTFNIAKKLTLAIMLTVAACSSFASGGKKPIKPPQISEAFCFLFGCETSGGGKKPPVLNENGGGKTPPSTEGNGGGKTPPTQRNGGGKTPPN